MAVASIVSALLAAKLRVLPRMSRPVISKLARASFWPLETAFLVCNISLPPYNVRESNFVHRWFNRKNRPGHVNPTAMKDVAGSHQPNRPYGRGFGVLASRVEINCSAAAGTATVPERTMSLAEISRPYTWRLSPLSGRIVEPSRETPANRPRALE